MVIHYLAIGILYRNLSLIIFRCLAAELATVWLVRRAGSYRSLHGVSSPGHGDLLGGEAATIRTASLVE